MADLKISQLTAGNPAQTNDEIPIARSGANFKITAGSISALPPTTAGANQVIYVNSAGTSLDGDPNFVYTATGNLGLGTTPSASQTWVAGSNTQKVVAVTEGATNSLMQLKGYRAAVSGNGILVLAKSRGATIGTETATSSGDSLGIVSFEGVNSSNTVAGSSYILGAQDGAAGATYVPGRMQFYTSDGTNIPAERMRIDSAGNVGIGTTSPGFALDVATATARIRVAPSTTTNLALVQATNGGGSGYFGLDSSAGGLSGTQYALTLWHNGNYPIVFGTNNTERARITSAGNFLIGTTTNTNSSLLVANGTISETVSSVQYLVASQFDVGTAPNQIPLNQYLGTMAFQDSTAISIGSQVVVGTATPDATIPVNAEISGNGFRYISMSNPNTGNSAVAVVRAIAGTGGETRVLAYGASHSTLANAGGLINYNATGALLLGTNGAERARITAAGELLVGTTSLFASEKLSVFGNTFNKLAAGGGSSNTSYDWLTGASGNESYGVKIVVDQGSSSTRHGMSFYTSNAAFPVERARIPAAGGFVVGTAALATTATDGFLYIPGCAGTPTGVPTALTGRVPLVVDTTNNKLYFYSGGAWRDAGP